MRIVPFVVCAVAVAALCAGARGAGSIDTTGAVFTFGASPDQGVLTTNAAGPAADAPTIPSLASHGTLGTFSSPLPAFPGGGTATDGPFIATVSQTLPGGTYLHTSYQVNPGVVVTYSGAVTILCSTGGTVDGTVRTNSANAPITIRMARGIELGDGAVIRTEMESSPVTIDIGRGFLAGAGASVEASGGDIEVKTHGLDGDSGNVVLNGTTVRTFQGGAVRVRAAGALTTSGAAFLSSYSGGMLLQAFGGNLTMSGTSRADTSGPTDILALEASGGVSITGDGPGANLYHGFEGALSVRAFGGDAEFLGAALTVAGSAHVAASGSVRVAGTSYLSNSGDLTLTAFGGDVAVSSSARLLAVQDMNLGATGNVVLSGGATLQFAGKAALRAPAGSVSAATGVTIGFAPDFSDAVSITAGVRVDLGGATVFAGKTLDVTAVGSVAVGGALGARSHVTITSCDADVDLTGASFQTLAAAGVSGDITVQSFGDAAGVINAADVSFTTDPAATKSGDVNLLVHQGKSNGPPEPVSINAFLLPKSVTVRTNAKLPAKSSVTITGVLDEGSGSPDYAAASTLEVGGATFPIAGMTAKGRSFEFAAPGILFRVTPARTASSRGAFTIVRTADVSGEVNTDGELRLRFFQPGFDAVGVAKLVAGKFTLGKVRGGLIIPCVFPQSVVATLKGAGKDTLTLVAGFSFAEYPGAIGGPGDVVIGGPGDKTGPNTTIAFGDTFTATIDGASFTRSTAGDKLTFKGNVGGITSVVIDLKAEKITVKGSKMTLAGVAAASGPLAVTISIESAARGVDARTVTVGLNSAGKSLKY